MNYNWKLSEEIDKTIVDELARQLNIKPIIAQLLAQRGFDSPEKAKSFFYSSLGDQHDPFLMDGMETAVKRVSKALERNEKILIYGDYDVDGTTGAALLYMFFSKLGADVDYYIPDRLKEGYGISITGVEYAASSGYTLLISVDCGVAAHKEIAFASTKGIDTIVCDHHEVEVSPEAIAVLDPIKPGCSYPFKYLSGCGVAYKFAKAVSMKLGKDELPDQYLDLVAIAAAADVVPLVGENRIFVQAGFSAIARHPRAGIKALFESSRVDHTKLTTGQVSFNIAPRINAVGRLGDAKRAVELLITDNEDIAAEFAQVLESENSHRKILDEKTFNEAKELALGMLAKGDRNSLVLHSEAWHPGVVGIVASRIVETFYRPTIMLATVDGVIRGSARSVVGYDIFAAIKACSDSLLQFGGHKFAAGLALAPENLDRFVNAFEEVVAKTILKDMKTPVISIDADLDLNDINGDFIKTLKMFEPFGPHNAKPVFRSSKVYLSDARIVGGSHLKMKLKSNSVVYDAIKFRNGDTTVKAGSRLDVVYSVDENHYAGSVSYQLQLKDFKNSE
ncbi:MAG: single-stranded-DNA-specific exonuclease RecJ [Bacteroidetes bacterium]|nr:single-stranded-DNA-specific exonuclease RecJ [Bacteroidota bacterium]MCL5738093.1 single-stranded-DNA-specific exonuclease RecJ [Bacteroidota bacterium]